MGGQMGSSGRRGAREQDGAEQDGSKPMPVFRREFQLRQKPVEATLRIAGLGQYEARLNGKSIAPDGLHQAWTDYRKTVTFDRYDLTKSLTAGKNVLGVMLGNGMYNVQRTKGRFTKFDGSFGTPKLIAELRLKYADGKTETIGTDGMWKAARGPLVFASTYGGEDYDARKELAGWDMPRFKDAEWAAATETEGPGGELIAAIAPDVRVIRTFTAPKETQLGPNKVVYDFGQNFAGWPRILVRGPAGAGLKLTPGELLNADGSAYAAPVAARTARRVDLYAARRPQRGGVETEVWLLRIPLRAGGMDWPGCARGERWSGCGTRDDAGDSRDHRGGAEFGGEGDGEL